MIKKEDIKVGAEFYIKPNDLRKCGIYIPNFNGGLPILFKIDSIDGQWLCCTPANLGNEFRIFSDVEIIMTFGVLSPGTPKVDEGKNANAKSEQVNHPSHYAWLKDLCGVEPLDMCRHLDFNTGNAINYLLRKDKVDGNKTKTEKRIEDLRKAVFYIHNEIKLLEHGAD